MISRTAIVKWHTYVKGPGTQAEAHSQTFSTPGALRLAVQLVEVLAAEPLVGGIEMLVSDP